MYITDISSLCSLITGTTTTPTAQRASQNRTLTASAASALQAPFTPGCPARYYPTVPLQLVEVKAFCYVLVTAQRADVLDNTELDSNCGAVAVRQRGRPGSIVTIMRRWSNAAKLRWQLVLLFKARWKKLVDYFSLFHLSERENFQIHSKLVLKPFFMTELCRSHGRRSDTWIMEILKTSLAHIK